MKGVKNEVRGATADEIVSEAFSRIGEILSRIGMVLFVWMLFWLTYTHWHHIVALAMELGFTGCGIVLLAIGMLHGLWEQRKEEREGPQREALRAEMKRLFDPGGKGQS